jgi:aspartate carbamoyltransferase catalytic subunit
MQLLTKPVTFERYILDLDTFSRTQIEEVLNTTDSMKEILSRDIKQVPVLHGRTIILLFCEKNEAVRASFEMAAQALSAHSVNLNYDGTSSVDCHSLVRVARTIQGMGASIVVMRHPQSGFPYQLTQYFQGTLINAGDGYHADPSQALVDLYTIRDSLGRIEKSKVLLVGDILHSGVARSCLWGLTKMDAKVTLCAPPGLLGMTAHWQKIWPNVRVTHNLDEVIEEADVIKILPVTEQRYQEGILPSAREYRNLYGISDERLQRAKKHVLILPTVTSSEGSDIIPSLLSSHKIVVEEQVTNGIAVRMALLYLLSGVK